MSQRVRSWNPIVLVLLASILLSACAAPTPQVVEKQVVQTVVVEKTVPVTVPVTVAVEKEVTRVVEVTAAPPTPTQKSAAPKQIILAEGTAIKTLDPYRSISAPEGHLIEMLFDTLVMIDYDKNQVVPELAESWEVGQDGLTWTFKLKKGVKFNDGSEFNAEVAKYSLSKMSNKEFNHVFYSQFSIIQDIEAVDNYTVRFKTQTPFSPLLINLAHYTAAMVAPAARDKWGEDFSQHPVGTGPYQLKEWKGDVVVLERNLNYFGTKPWADTIKYVSVPENGARLAMLETGEADVVAKVPPQELKRLKDKPSIRLEIAPSLFTIALEVNLAKTPLSDPRIRQAMMYAIDRDAITKNIMLGMAENPISPIGPGMPNRKTFDPWPYNPEKAKQLLAEAGYAKGFTVQLWSPHGRYLMDAECAEAVQGYLRNVGIHADLQYFEWSPYMDVVNKPATADNPKELFLLGRATMGADFWMYRLWNSKASGNWTGYKNARVDELLELGRVTFDSAKLDQIYGEIQEIVFKQDLPFLFLYNQKAVYGVQKNVKGVKIVPNEYLLLNYMSKE